MKIRNPIWHLHKGLSFLPVKNKSLSVNSGSVKEKLKITSYRAHTASQGTLMHTRQHTENFLGNLAVVLDLFIWFLSKNSSSLAFNIHTV